VIANGVDLDLFRPALRNGHRYRVGFAGQWMLYKGLHVLLSAWQEVRRQIPQAELWIAGGPDLYKGTHPVPEEKMLVLDKAMATTIEGLNLVGVLPRDQMPDFWSQVDLACFPSVWEEPFGLSALEAMACGVPVVVSDSGALPEVVGDAGIVVPKSDEGALAQALMGLLLSPGSLERLGTQARLRACAFDQTKRVPEMLALVEQVADGI
jgi:glycosyltransferase involved in cell wall biosynthesis